MREGMTGLTNFYPDFPFHFSHTSLRVTPDEFRRLPKLP